MKITVLVENNALINKYYLAEYGLCLFIEINNKRILFDIGHSNIFIENAIKMNINLENLDYIFFSHGHNDHKGGIIPFIKRYKSGKSLVKPCIIAHPDAFERKFNDDIANFSELANKEDMSAFAIKKTRIPLWIDENLVFLGEIPRLNNFESQIDNNFQSLDKILDDSALVYKSPKGLVIVTGCSHSGICNIINYAKKICNTETVIDIIGGFHLIKASQELLNATISTMKKENIIKLHPCHCTDLFAKIALSKQFDINEIGVGSILEY